MLFVDFLTRIIEAFFVDKVVGNYFGRIERTVTSRRIKHCCSSIWRIFLSIKYKY